MREKRVDRRVRGSITKRSQEFRPQLPFLLQIDDAGVVSKIVHAATGEYPARLMASLS